MCALKGKQCHDSKYIRRFMTYSMPRHPINRSECPYKNLTTSPRIITKRHPEFLHPWQYLNPISDHYIVRYFENFPIDHSQTVLPCRSVSVRASAAKHPSQLKSRMLSNSFITRKRRGCTQLCLNATILACQWMRRTEFD